jgi:hypothetical protein
VSGDGRPPADRLWEVSVELVRALEAAAHFVENVDLINADEPRSPWPDWYPSGYVGLLTATGKWYDLLTNPSGDE